MKSTFANARENLSDEQLKHVTGGARINSRPDAAGDHLIDHGDLDLHGADAAAMHRLPPGSHHSGPSRFLEQIQFSGPVTVQGLEDSHGNAITGINQIDVWAIRDIPGEFKFFDLGSGQVAAIHSQTIINDATAQGDVADAHSTLPVFDVVAVAASPGLPDSDGRNDAGERENTTWPLPSSPDGGH